MISKAWLILAGALAIFVVVLFVDADRKRKKFFAEIRSRGHQVPLDRK